MAAFDGLIEGPIPGENLSQDPKTKPWKRPPQYVKFDDALEYVIDEVIPEKAYLPSVIVLAQQNVPLTTIVTTSLVGMTSRGKFSLDVALLLAGPVYKLMSRILDEFEVSYLTGFESAQEFTSKVSGTATETAPKAKPLTKAQERELEAISEEMKEEIPQGGLMGAPVEGEETMDIPMDDSDAGGLIEAPEEPSEAINEEPM